LAQPESLRHDAGADFPRPNLHRQQLLLLQQQHATATCWRCSAPRSRNKQAIATSVTISRFRIDWHDVESYFRQGSAPIRFDDQNNVVFNKLDKFVRRRIMMDCSQCPIDPTLKTVFTNTPGRTATSCAPRASQCFSCLGLCRQAGMTGNSPSYTMLQRENALVIPRARLAKAVSKAAEVNSYAIDKRIRARPHLSRLMRGVCGADRALAVGSTYSPTSTRRPRHSCRTCVANGAGILREWQC